MSSLNTYLLHLPVRKSVSIGACLIVIVYILTNSGQIIQTAKYPPLLAPESDVDIIFSHSSTPTVDPDWCDPSTYPPDSLEHLLLAPQANKDPVWGAENHLQFKSWCSCRQTHSCKPNQNEVVLLNVNHFQTWYKNSIDSNNGGETVW
ncbi:hypothetical protein DL93DRAFT_496159 [Clavulina sp. PMI_390]|nr:hypothetical protein DL93DRAFT_496159 [Clavulina sp. PMI_390]